MRLINFLFCFSVVCLISCSSNADILGESADVLNNAQPDVSLTPMLKSKDLVANNTFIDVDIEAFDKVVRDNFDPNEPKSSLIAMEMYPQDFAMIQAARYRYDSSISVVDGFWVSSAKCGADLNMSERTFNSMHNDTMKANEMVKEARANGENISLPAYTQTYLDRWLVDFTEK